MAAFDDIDYSYLGVEGLKGDRPIRVSNLGRRKVSYVLPELNNTTRTFMPAQNGRVDSKVISFHELYLLNNTPGGPQLIFDNLQIKDNDARVALGLPTDPEFDYSIEDIRKLIQEGSQDEILDALEFGPFYLAQWIKNVAVAEGVNDYSKRKFIEGLFRMNLDQAQENFRWAEGDPLVGNLYQQMKPEEGQGRKRRTGQAKEPKKRQRRVPIK